MIWSITIPKKKMYDASIKLDKFLKKAVAARILLLALPVVLIPAITEAASNTDAMIRAFDPLIDLAQAVSFPLTFLVLIGGMLFIIIGQRARGLQMIKWAVVGYIGVQFTPGIMKILMQVGQAMRQAQQ